MSNSQLYFAYAGFLDPDRIAETVPGAEFRFTAHYPETKLTFIKNGGQPVATLTDDVGHTVWGAVFEVPAQQVPRLIEAERSEGRIPGWEMRAIDREGNKYECLTFVSPEPLNGHHLPDPDYLRSMIVGARHWNLPAGWVVGLEDLADDPLFG